MQQRLLFLLLATDKGLEVDKMNIKKVSQLINANSLDATAKTEAETTYGNILPQTDYSVNSSIFCFYSLPCFKKTLAQKEKI